MSKIWRFIFSFVIIASFTSCKQDVIIPFQTDYRQDLEGDYTGVKYTAYQNYSMPSPIRDTINDVMTCSIDPNANNGMIINGKIFYLDSINHADTFDLSAHTSNSVTFRNDSLFFYHYWSSPGGYSSYTFKGKKVN